MGTGTRADRQNKYAISSRPAAKHATVRPSAQPHRGLCTRAKMTRVTPLISARAPIGSGSRSRTSSRCAVSRKTRAPATSTNKPNGMLTANAHRHVPISTRIAPSDGPSAVATPPTPPHVAIAVARRPAGTSARMTAIADGVIIAHPIACTTRAAINAGGFGASVQAAAANVKIASPLNSTRLRP